MIWYVKTVDKSKVNMEKLNEEDIILQISGFPNKERALQFIEEIGVPIIKIDDAHRTIYVEDSVEGESNAR